MRIATWNVNSVRARLPQVLGWVGEVAPDVLLLQEIKCETEAFPRLEFEGLGYHVAVVGQKSYNGVALLAKEPPRDPLTRLPGEEEDEQARYLEASVGDLRIASVYLPNGNPAGDDLAASPKFSYKLRWMDRLAAHARHMLATGAPFALGGDFNVIPESRDVFAPAAFANDALFRPETRRRWRALLNLGLTEAYRALHDDIAYTFWDYQAGCWPRDQGLRIDHFLLSPPVADRLEGCAVDRGPRGGEKASDHTPVLLDLRSRK